MAQWIKSSAGIRSLDGSIPIEDKLHILHLSVVLFSSFSSFSSPLSRAKPLFIWAWLCISFNKEHRISLRSTKEEKRVNSRAQPTKTARLGFGCGALARLGWNGAETSAAQGNQKNNFPLQERPQLLVRSPGHFQLAWCFRLVCACSASVSLALNSPLTRKPCPFGIGASSINSTFRNPGACAIYVPKQ
jgi:hypothetical protein